MAMEQVGPMDDRYFLHCEDLDWCMRFRIAGWQILFVPGVEIIHNKGVCGADRPIRVEWYKHKGMILFYRKFFRRQYPVGLMYLVTAMVWTRFTILAALLSLKRLVK
jgi:GT2 family glycosyltransferase